MEPDCPYSAVRLYRLGLAWDGVRRDPDGTEISPATAAYFARIAVGGVDPTPELVEDALVDGPWGRCVYDCDNDVIDHQVVAMEFEGGVTVDFQLTAFIPLEGRRTRLFGTHGQIVSDGRHLAVTDFRTGLTRSIDTLGGLGASADAGHGGGDAGLVEAMLSALHSGDSGPIRSGIRDSVVSHSIAFAAERARHRGTVESVPAVGIRVAPDTHGRPESPPRRA